MLNAKYKALNEGLDLYIILSEAKDLIKIIPPLSIFPFFALSHGEKYMKFEEIMKFLKKSLAKKEKKGYHNTTEL